jgi:hypothetical protein
VADFLGHLETKILSQNFVRSGTLHIENLNIYMLVFFFLIDPADHQRYLLFPFYPFICKHLRFFIKVFIKGIMYFAAAFRDISDPFTCVQRKIASNFLAYTALIVKYIHRSLTKINN